MSELDLDAIEALLAELDEAQGVINQWTIEGKLARHAPALVARVRELDAECNKMGEILIGRGCDVVISELRAVHDLLERIQAETGGDGTRSAPSSELLGAIEEALK